MSRPRAEGYSYKKRFYRRTDVAEDYDCHRFSGTARQRRNARKWRAILAALAETRSVRSILDMPCGTGRFTGALEQRGYQVLAADISLEMMQMARVKQTGDGNLLGYVQADAEALPLKSGSFDCVMSIRFMFHVDPPTRVNILREMGRVTSRWLIVDYRHRYSLRYAKWRLLRSLGLTLRPLERVSRAQLESEFHAAGLAVRNIIPVTRWFSDKWIVLGESSAG